MPDGQVHGEWAVISRILGFALALGAASMSAFASADDIVVSDDGSFEADISLQNPTRLSFANDTGTQLIFNQPEGATPDIEAVIGSAGDVFLTVTEGHPGQSLAGFIQTEQGRTYRVKFNIKMKDAGQITIVNREDRERLAKEAAVRSARPDPAVSATRPVKWDTASEYHADIVGLMRALWHSSHPHGLVRSHPAPSVSLGQGVSAKSVYTWRASNVEAIEFSITNTLDYTFDPELFDDAFGRRVAVAYTSNAIAPGGTGRVLLVREAN